MFSALAFSALIGSDNKRHYTTAVPFTVSHWMYTYEVNYENRKLSGLNGGWDRRGMWKICKSQLGAILHVLTIPGPMQRGADSDIRCHGYNSTYCESLSLIHI